MIPLPIFFNEDVLAEYITLPEEASKHVVQVLRMQNGEQLQLTDGKGNLCTCIITDNHRKKCQIQVVERSFQPKPGQRICIAISPLKNNNRFEWFLEKATEVGIGEIVPLICERTEKQQVKEERLKGIIISAMLQSRQVWMPILHAPVKFEKFIATQQFSEKYIAHCAEGIGKILLQNSISKSAISYLLLIGPEGDFSTDEIEFSLSENFKPVSLGHTRLRTETAGIAGAITLMNALAKHTA